MTRLRRWRWAAVAPLAAALAAGCGGSPAQPSVATISGAGGTTTTGAGGGGPSTASSGGPGSSVAMAVPGGGQGFGKLLAYAQCMRTHGEPNFPDPQRSSGGGVSLSFSKSSGIDPGSAQFQSAQQACHSKLPSGGPGGPGITAAARRQALAYSQCMRTHGVSNFPDPQFSAHGISIRVSGQVGQGPQFQSAQQACRSKLPGARAGG